MDTNIGYVARIRGFLEELWRFLRWPLLVVSNIILASISVSFIYGWITLGDIKKECDRLGYDYDEVLYELILPAPIPQIEITKDSMKQTFVPPSDDAAFKRLRRQALDFSQGGEFKRNDAGEMVERRLEASVIQYQPLLLFLTTSKNVCNALFCLGLGYAVSYLVLLSKFFRKDSLDYWYLFWRPIAGSAFAVTLFLLVLAGGDILWTSSASLGDMSIGGIALLGGLYCEAIGNRWLLSVEDVYERKQSE